MIRNCLLVCFERNTDPQIDKRPGGFRHRAFHRIRSRFGCRGLSPGFTLDRTSVLRSEPDAASPASNRLLVSDPARLLPVTVLLRYRLGASLELGRRFQGRLLRSEFATTPSTAPGASPVCRSSEIRCRPFGSLWVSRDLARHRQLCTLRIWVSKEIFNYLTSARTHSGMV